MSERVRHSRAAALIMSKRLVVAACAAVAMVLGALSGGASFFTPGGRTNTPQANLGIATGVTDQGSGSNTTPSATSSGLRREHTLETIQLQGGAYNGSSISIPASSYAGRLSTSVSLQGPALSVSAHASAIVPSSVSIDIGITTGNIGLSTSTGQPSVTDSSSAGGQSDSTQTTPTTPTNTDNSSSTGTSTSDQSQQSTSQPDTQATPDTSSQPPTTP